MAPTVKLPMQQAAKNLVRNKGKLTQCFDQYAALLQTQRDSFLGEISSDPDGTLSMADAHRYNTIGSTAQIAKMVEALFTVRKIACGDVSESEGRYKLTSAELVGLIKGYSRYMAVTDAGWREQMHDGPSDDSGLINFVETYKTELAARAVSLAREENGQTQASKIEDELQPLVAASTKRSF